MPIIAQNTNNIDQNNIDTVARPSLPILYVAQNSKTSASSTATSTALIKTSSSVSLSSTASTKLPNTAVDSTATTYVLYILAAAFIITLGVLSFQNSRKKSIDKLVGVPPVGTQS